MGRTVFSVVAFAAVCALVLMSLASGSALPPQERPLPAVPEPLRSSLAGFLLDHAMAPEAYVID
ncbi:MAG: hypothetical protein NTX99_08980 [Candidatus Aminicenantes bacterium]|nr:hypothetical protein [Candidatus Aminicenantes bacterium]